MRGREVGQCRHLEVVSSQRACDKGRVVRACGCLGEGGEDGDAPGYSQEYLNDPFDNSDAYIRKDDMLAMRREDYETSKRIAVGCDFAVSKKDKANRTSFTIGGTDSENKTCIIDQRVNRWDTQEWMEEMFLVQARHDPEVFFVEDGVIWKAVAPTLYREMNRRGVWLNCQPLLPIKDKATRGRPYQKRSRSGAVAYDKEASWYVAYETEILRFTEGSDATLDDQFDSTATLFLGLDRMPEVEEDDFEAEEERDMRRLDPRMSGGRSRVTGY
jgi:predicted phage terminase large subunit-like protein